VRRKQKQAEIDVKLREFETRLRAEIAGALPGPPPTPYELETPVGINAIRREE
jgi:hypothetical protein